MPYDDESNTNLTVDESQIRIVCDRILGSLGLDKFYVIFLIYNCCIFNYIKRYHDFVKLHTTTKTLIGYAKTTLQIVNDNANIVLQNRLSLKM